MRHHIASNERYAKGIPAKPSIDQANIRIFVAKVGCGGGLEGGDINLLGLSLQIFAANVGWRSWKLLLPSKLRDELLLATADLFY